MTAPASPHVPPSRPEISRAMVDGWVLDPGFPEAVRQRALDALQGARPFIVGRRGYYRDALGASGRNDRGIFDDALVVGTAGEWATFNGNTDPAAHRAGIATLVPGVWTYQLGIHGLSKPEHQRYPALVQAAPVTVARDGQAAPSTGWFGINIHRAGNFETLSEGCQTVWRPQWAEFLTLVTELMATYNVRTIPYVLTARADG